MKMLIILYLFVGEKPYKIKEFSSMAQCQGSQVVLELIYNLPTKKEELGCTIFMVREGGGRFEVKADELNNEI